jgi:hypothetical protein
MRGPEAGEDPPPEVFAELRKALEVGIAGGRCKLLGPYEASPDRIVRIEAPGPTGLWQVRIVGSEREEKARRVTVTSTSIGAVTQFLEGEGGTYLRLQGVVSQLAALGSEKCGTDGVSLSVLRHNRDKKYEPVAQSEPFRPGDILGVQAKADFPGAAILIDSYGSDRLCQLVWPNIDYLALLLENRGKNQQGVDFLKGVAPRMHDNTLATQPRMLPTDFGFTISENQLPGRARYRLLCMTEAISVQLPSLKPPSGDFWEENLAWEKALLKHLEKMLTLLEKDHRAFRMAEARYTVAHDGGVG